MWSSTSWIFSSSMFPISFTYARIWSKMLLMSGSTWAGAEPSRNIYRATRRTRSNRMGSHGGAERALWRLLLGHWGQRKGRLSNWRHLRYDRSKNRPFWSFLDLTKSKKTLKSQAAINSLSGAVSQPGERGTTDTRRINYVNTIMNCHTFYLFPYKAHWYFPNKLICSSQWSPFSQIPFFY